MSHRMLLAALIAVGMAAPARAQQGAPQLAAVSSMRHEYVIVFEGIAGEVCTVDWESAQRTHGACNQLVTVPAAGLVAGRVIEFISYDGTYYERIDAGTTWTSYPVEGYDPAATINETYFGWVTPGTELDDIARTVTNLGAEQVRGAEATHYQIWVEDAAFNAEAGGQVVYDIWVDGAGLPVKDQVNTLDYTLEGFGTGRLESIWTYWNLNTPVTVSVPPAAQVVPGEMGTEHAGPMALWAAGPLRPAER
jgi:hypothetical protein